MRLVARGKPRQAVCVRLRSPSSCPTPAVHLIMSRSFRLVKRLDEVVMAQFAIGREAALRRPRPRRADGSPSTGGSAFSLRR